MFSYLHGVRPGNRRQQPATSASYPAQHVPSPSQNDSSIAPAAPSSQDVPPDESHTSSINDGSSLSIEPPLLPPIPRVSSRRGSSVGKDNSSESDGGQDNTNDHRASEDQETNTMAPSAKASELKASRRPEAQGQRMEATSTERRQSSGRTRRPIDIAFENMRSYTEPPFRQSIMMPVYNSSNQAPSHPYQYPPPAFPPPPPPPKTSYSSVKGSIKSKFPLQPQRNPPPPPTAPPSQMTRPVHPTDPPPRSQTARASYVQPHSQDSTATNQGKGKGKLNLRNPLSLLARRRSSQALHEASLQNQSTPAVPLRDDFDPRIRGKVVHDFSVPRPGRPNTSGGPGSSSNLQAIDEQVAGSRIPPFARSGGAIDEISPIGLEKDHAPMFKEHFDDGGGLEKDGPTMKKSQAFMNSISQQQSQPEPDPTSLPAFARNLPSSVANTTPADNRKSPIPSPKPLEPVLESPSLQQSALPSPPLSQLSSHSRPSSINDQSLQGLGSPRRYKSNASRFSFDLAGVGSAVQEKLLEDKHRQKEQRKERQSVASLGDDLDDEDDYQNFDDMDDPGLEERIPGVNADDDDNEGSLPVSHQALDNFHFVSPNKSSFESAASPVSTGLTSPGTPRDHGGQPIGFAVLKTSQDQSNIPSGSEKAPESGERSLRPRSTPGDKSNSNLQVQGLQRIVSSDSNLADLPQRKTYQDDELYFDDGMIEDLEDDGSSQDFDESVFDDNGHGLYGLPLRDRTLKPSDVDEDDGEIFPPQATEIQQPLDEAAAEVPKDSSSSSRPSVKSESLSAELRDALTDLNQPNRPPLNRHPGLTQDNLAAYDHNDLAYGVMQASQNGAFDRRNSASSYSEPEVSAEISSENQRSSQLVFDMSGFEEDDAGSDDDIVAIANAEALENDDDEFYGQEFGFYAQASGEAEYANGGYFGRPPEGVHRSHSGRDAFQEPSLTPITERSEFSNRNSLAMHGYPLSGSNYPSELQLSSMMNLPEDGMTLEALMKLRRSAWGGSNASLHSSSNSQNSGSPLTQLPAGAVASSNLQQQNNANINKQANIVSAGSNQNLSASFYSFNSSNGHISSNDSDGSPSADSPTITLTAPTLPPPPPPTTSAPIPIHQSFSSPPPPMPSGPPPPIPNSQSNSLPPQSQLISASLPSRSMGPPPIPTTAGTGKRRSWAPGHSRHSSGGGETIASKGTGGSGAESVSYKEEGGKWILERRRTGDGGEVEILGRSIIEGGRI